MIYLKEVGTDVERVANISYGDAGVRYLLDVYRQRSHPSGGPTLVHLHGGGFVGVRKNSQKFFRQIN